MMPRYMVLDWLDDGREPLESYLNRVAATYPDYEVLNVLAGPAPEAGPGAPARAKVSVVMKLSGRGGACPLGVTPGDVAAGDVAAGRSGLVMPCQRN